MFYQVNSTIRFWNYTTDQSIALQQQLPQIYTYRTADDYIHFSYYQDGKIWGYSVDETTGSRVSPVAIKLDNIGKLDPIRLINCYPDDDKLAILFHDEFRIYHKGKIMYQAHLSIKSDFCIYVDGSNIHYINDGVYYKANKGSLIGHVNLPEYANILVMYPRNSGAIIELWTNGLLSTVQVANGVCKEINCIRYKLLQNYGLVRLYKHQDDRILCSTHSVHCVDINVIKYDHPIADIVTNGSDFMITYRDGSKRLVFPTTVQYPAVNIESNAELISWNCGQWGPIFFDYYIV